MAKYKTVGYHGKQADEVPGKGGLPHPDKYYRVIVVLRDSEGEDYPENAGKWFLYSIVK